MGIKHLFKTEWDGRDGTIKRKWTVILGWAGKEFAILKAARALNSSPRELFYKAIPEDAAVTEEMLSGGEWQESLLSGVAPLGLVV